MLLSRLEILKNLVDKTMLRLTATQSTLPFGVPF